MPNQPAITSARNAIEAAASAFAAGDPGRSLAVVTETPFAGEYFHAADIARPAASVMKIAIAMALVKKAAAGEVDLHQTVAVQDLPPTRYVSILAGLDPAHRLSLDEVMRLALITSDNPLTVELQRHVLYAEVNALFGELDLTATMAAGFSEDELGPRNRVNRMTASDSVALLREVCTNPLYVGIRKGLENNLRNNRIPALLPDSAVVAHKTGSLNGVVNDIGLVTDSRIRFYIAALSDDQADPERTAADIARCALAIYEALKSAITA